MINSVKFPHASAWFEICSNSKNEFLDAYKGEEESKEEEVAPAKKANLNHLVKELDKVVVQKYLERPLLIHGRKFDLRMFMVVVCCKPWFVLAGPGYCRLSLNQFTLDDFTGKEMTQESRITHLTNAAVQKKHKDFRARKAETIMSMEGLRDFLLETE